MGTVVGLLLALALSVWQVELGSLFPWMAFLLVAVVWLIEFLSTSNFAVSLQKAGKITTSRIFELFRQDRKLLGIQAAFCCWSLFSLAVALSNLATFPLRPDWLQLVWLVATGGILDLLFFAQRTRFSYLNPLEVLDRMQEQAQKEIKGGRDTEFCGWVESLSDMSARALHEEHTALCSAGVEAIRSSLQSYLEELQLQKKTKQFDGETSQRASYVLHYGLERLSLLQGIALEKKAHLVSNQMITALSKIAVTAGSVDAGLATAPLHFIGLLSKKAIQAPVEGSGFKALLILSQVGKVLAGQHLEKALLPLIRQMEEVAKEMFRQDKSIPLNRLTEPFQGLKGALQAEPRAEGLPVIGEIDRVLGDFANLELVLRAIPPIPTVNEE